MVKTVWQLGIFGQLFPLPWKQSCPTHFMTGHADVAVHGAVSDALGIRAAVLWMMLVKSDKSDEPLAPD